MRTDGEGGGVLGVAAGRGGRALHFHTPSQHAQPTPASAPPLPAALQPTPTPACFPAFHIPQQSPCTAAPAPAPHLLHGHLQQRGHHGAVEPLLPAHLVNHSRVGGLRSVAVARLRRRARCGRCFVVPGVPAREEPGCWARRASASASAAWPARCARSPPVLRQRNDRGSCPQLCCLATPQKEQLRRALLTRRLGQAHRARPHHHHQIRLGASHQEENGERPLTLPFLKPGTLTPLRNSFTVCRYTAATAEAGTVMCSRVRQGPACSSRTCACRGGREGGR